VARPRAAARLRLPRRPAAVGEDALRARHAGPAGREAAGIEELKEQSAAAE